MMHVSELETIRDREVMMQALLDEVMCRLDPNERRDDRLHKLVAAARECATRNIGTISAVLALLATASAA